MSNLEESDSGYYYCIAVNEYGTDRCFINLDIKPRSVKPAVNVVVETPQDKNETKTTRNEIVSKELQPTVRINATESRQSENLFELFLYEGKEDLYFLDKYRAI